MSSENGKDELWFHVIDVMISEEICKNKKSEHYLL